MSVCTKGIFSRLNIRALSPFISTIFKKGITVIILLIINYIRIKGRDKDVMIYRRSNSFSELILLFCLIDPHRAAKASSYIAE